MSFSTFFSRASASTSINNSRLIAILQSNIRHQSRLIDVGKRNRYHLAVYSDFASGCSDLLQFSDESPPPIQRQSNFDLNAFSYKFCKIARPFQWPVQPWRRNLQPVVINAFNSQQAGQLIADHRTILDVHSASLVDENPHEPAAVGKFNVDEFIT